LDVIRTSLCLLIGFIGQYFDASIGMGYGTTTVPLLLLLGVSPIYTVPAVLLSKTILGVLSGGVHQIAGNVRREVVLSLIVAGILGTFLGVPLTFFLPDREVGALIGIILIDVITCVGLYFNLKLGTNG